MVPLVAIYLLWGVWFLKEESGPQRIVAALVMIAGVFVISFAQ